MPGVASNAAGSHTTRIMKNTRASVTGAAGAVAFAIGLTCASPVRAQSNDIGNERRITLFPYHKINEKLTGFGYLGYVNNPEKEYKTAYLKHIDFLRQKYGPNVKFLCCGYPGDGIDKNVQELVDSQIKAGKKDIGYALVPSVNELGCHWHPAVIGQQKMADAVAPVLAAFMGW